MTACCWASCARTPGRAFRRKSAACSAATTSCPACGRDPAGHPLAGRGELLHWHPHIHTLVTCGAFTPDGEFLELPELDLERLQAAWQEAVFALYLAEQKIEPEVVENMRSWPHSGFSVDQSVYLAAGDRAGIERLVGYMTRCPFSLSRLVKVSETGQVIYKAEKGACRAFPDPQRDELARGGAPGTPGRRNFQILDPLEFLAEFTRPGVPGAPFRPRART